MCLHCGREVAVTPQEQALLGKDITTIKRGTGCTHCNGTGYRGRIAVHEIVTIDRNIRRMISRGAEIEEIEAYAKAHHIAAGAVVSGVGCVSRWRLRDATGVRVRSGEEDVEIVSLMGTVSEYGCHLHASFSREDLSAFGGHLLPGCTVNTTAEIVLAEIRSCVFTRRPDSETGYEELEIGPAYPEETRNDRREER